MGRDEGKTGTVVEWTFSLGQIQDHCEKIENMCLTAHPDGKLMFQSTLIIRELLEKIDCLVVEKVFSAEE